MAEKRVSELGDRLMKTPQTKIQRQRKNVRAMG
jgi:hypothetical protein